MTAGVRSAPMTDGLNILVIVPTYGQFGYARRTLDSLFEHTPTARAIVVDDGSPDWNSEWFKGVAGETQIVNYLNNQGLTHALNVGLYYALELDQYKNVDFVAAVNSDIVFSAGWENPLVYNLQHGYDLVGPVSNAPGVTSKGVQDIKRWAHGVGITDTPTSFKKVFKAVSHYGNHIEPCDINGFFMMAKPKTWREFAHNAPHEVFPPRIETMPSGRPNPTPTMTGQEDWLCHKIKKAKGRVGCCPASYVFHYRSVTRGEKHATGDWQRMKEG